jgi:DNA-binding NarL/FixJ family response regulator
MNTPRKSIQLGDPLTEKETQVLLLCCVGCSGKDIAEKLDMATSTVTVHKRSIYKKMGTRNVAQTCFKWATQNKG